MHRGCYCGHPRKSKAETQRLGFVGASREAFEVVDTCERIYRRLRTDEAASGGQASQMLPKDGAGWIPTAPRPVT